MIPKNEEVYITLLVPIPSSHATKKDDGTRFFNKSIFNLLLPKTLHVQIPPPPPQA